MHIRWKSQLAIAILGGLLLSSLGACDGAVTGPQGAGAPTDAAARGEDGFQFGGIDGLERLQHIELEKRAKEPRTRTASSALDVE